MAKINSFHEYVMNDVFYDFDFVTSRPMFGGFGIYKDGIFFALIAQEKLYFKVDETNKSDFEKLGSEPFVYTIANGKSTTMNYFEVPVDIIENKEEIEKWVEKSVVGAINSKKKVKT